MAAHPGRDGGLQLAVARCKLGKLGPGIGEDLGPKEPEQIELAPSHLGQALHRVTHGAQLDDLEQRGLLEETQTAVAAAFENQ